MALSQSIQDLLEKVGQGKALTGADLKTIKDSGEEEEFLSKVTVAQKAAQLRQDLKGVM